MDVPGNGNIISDIGVNAVDETGSCVQVTVSVRDQCTPRVRLSNGTVISGRGFSGGGVSVSKRRSDRVRISVPNCEGVKLVMWVVCEVEGGQEMLRFVVSRGVNLHPTSHGLVGKLKKCYLLLNINFKSPNYLINGARDTHDQLTTN